MQDFNQIAKKWQKHWETAGIFRVKEDKYKKKYYVLEMYPYPSGSGLHMGHVRNYAIGDCFARFKRMKGFNVLYPMGYDAFGLPAENAAIENKIHPEEWTLNNMDVMRVQQKSLGLSYDWCREIASLKPEYYKWNQWIFIKFYEMGLAYRKKGNVNWCPGCKTVLANEQVHDGQCWRCKSDVVQRELVQWFFNIKKYADELLSDLDKLLDWPERVKLMQKNWIGKSYGVELSFKIVDSDKTIITFTTRVDTVYGITYLVLAPEHPIIPEIVNGTEYEKPVLEFVNKTINQPLIERTAEGSEKNGIFTGRFFVNPFTEEKCPLYVADYAIMEYGTGAVMAVPAHDQRDFEFARKYNLPIKVVINPKDVELIPEKMSMAYADDGVLVNSADFDGMANSSAIESIADFAEKNGFGRRTHSYKLRDWLISRQRYWGTPIPIIYCDNCGVVPVSYDELPVLLPRDVEFGVHGNPLATSKSFVNAKCPRCKGNARRETDTMDTFVDSSWYFFRYCSPHEDNSIFTSESVNYWMPIDQYIGGIEHAVMHLLYSRFFTKALRDLGLHDFDEPFNKLLCQGMVIKDGAKMSKSLCNVVNPEEIIGKYGADTARIFMLFTALPEKELNWSEQGVEGSYRFLKRVFSLAEKSNFQNEKFFPYGIIHCIEKYSHKEIALVSKINRTIKTVNELIDEFKLSLAIGDIMEMVNEVYRYKDSSVVNMVVYEDVLKNIVLLISPFAPHLAEEMWECLGNKGFVSLEKWPEFDESKIDLKAEAGQELVVNTISDIRNVIELVKITPKKITLIVANDWKYKLFDVLIGEIENTRDFRLIMRKVMAVSELKNYSKDVANIVPKILNDITKLPRVLVDRQIEINNFSDTKEYIGKMFGCEIEIVKEEESKEPKAKNAMPNKPGVVLG